MKISQLETKLAEIKAAHGDLMVHIEHSIGFGYDVEGVIVSKPYTWNGIVMEYEEPICYLSEDKS